MPEHDQRAELEDAAPHAGGEASRARRLSTTQARELVPMLMALYAGAPIPSPKKPTDKRRRKERTR